jgi:hypothetical protein
MSNAAITTSLDHLKARPPNHGQQVLGGVARRAVRRSPRREDRLHKHAGDLAPHDRIENRLGPAVLDRLEQVETGLAVVVMLQGIGEDEVSSRRGPSGPVVRVRGGCGSARGMAQSVAALVRGDPTGHGREAIIQTVGRAGRSAAAWRTGISRSPRVSRLGGELTAPHASALAAPPSAPVVCGGSVLPTVAPIAARAAAHAGYG